MSQTTSTSAKAGEDRTAELADQVARTDAALFTWRNSTSERRRTAWEIEQQRLALEAHHRLMRARIGVTVVCGVLLAMVGVALATGFLELPFPRGAEPAAVAQTATPPRAPEAQPAALVVPAAPEAPEPAAAPRTASPEEARVWLEDRHQWATWITEESGALSVRYLDGAGKPALEPWPCKGSGETGVRRCSVGRTLDRIIWAIEREGAAPGRWTVQGCSSEGCTDLGSFEAGAPSPR
jgi:hypothetical protein